MKFFSKIMLPCLILVIVVLVIYFPLTKTFYQQDEWHGYGMYLANGPAMIFSSATYLSKNLGSIFLDTNGLINIFLGEGRIFTRFLQYEFYKEFPLDVTPVAWFSIILHATNTILVFLLAKKIFRKDLHAFFGSLFFAVNSVSQSSITWIAASVNTLPSTTLILLAVLFYFKFVDLFENKWLFCSFISIYLSLFFKETGLFLFLLLPLFSFVYKKYSIIEFIKKYWYFFLTMGLIVVFRLYEFKSVHHEEVLFLTGSSKYFLDSLVVRSVLYPLTSLSLSIVPPDIFLNFARYITNVYYPFVPEGQFILIAQTAVLDLLAIVLSAVIGVISFIILKLTEIKIRKHVIFWFIFLLASFLPYIIISKSYSYLESRYYYVASVAWAVIFAWVLKVCEEKIKIRLLQFLILIAFLFFLFAHINAAQKNLNQLVKDSQVRIGIIDQIKRIKPTLENNKNIFYITGDSDFYLVGNKVPFQTGMGYNLMSLYYNSGKVPKGFIDETYLFEIGSQGYKESSEYGFGYFSDLDSLRSVFKEKKIEKTAVKAFYYNSKANTIEDITSQIIIGL